MAPAQCRGRRPAALSQDRDLSPAGDPVAPGELIAAPSADRLDRIAICLLDCDAPSQTERLRRRGEPAELLPHRNAFADWMRKHVRPDAQCGFA